MTKNSVSWTKSDSAAAGSEVRSNRGISFLPLGAVALAAAFVASCTTAPSPSIKATRARNVPELALGIPVGYLTGETRPDGVDLLPPPPTPGSAAMAFDEQIRTDAVAMHGSARWKQATLDADSLPDKGLKAFECALGTSTSTRQTPRLYQMMQRVMVDAGYSAVGAKNKYQRARPFVVHNDAMCTPGDDAKLRANGSYPSGHSAIGWASALVLAQLAPDRADKLIARGRSFGESRIVCNVHWMSDVVSGWVMGAATVARLQSVPEFAEDIAIARGEVAKSKTAGIKPAGNCTVEAEALSEKLKETF